MTSTIRNRVLSAAELECFGNDIDAVHGALTTAGVRFSAKPHVVHRTATSELWLAEFTDPDGNPLALMGEVALA